MDIWAHVITVFIAAIPPTLLALAAVLTSLRNNRELKTVKTDVKTVETATNSMKDALVKATGEAAFAAGAAEQREKTDTSPAAQAAIIAAAIIATAQIAADKVKADARTAEAKLKADEENRKG